MMKIDRDEFDRMRAASREQMKAMVDAPGVRGLEARSYLMIDFDEFAFEELNRGTPGPLILAAIIDRCSMAIATKMKSLGLGERQATAIVAKVPERILQLKGAIDGLSAEALASCSVSGKPVN